MPSEGPPEYANAARLGRWRPQRRKKTTLPTPGRDLNACWGRKNAATVAVWACEGTNFSSSDDGSLVCSVFNQSLRLFLKRSDDSTLFANRPRLPSFVASTHGLRRKPRKNKSRWRSPLIADAPINVYGTSCPRHRAHCLACTP